MEFGLISIDFSVFDKILKNSVKYSSRKISATDNKMSCLCKDNLSYQGDTICQPQVIT